MCVVFVRVYMYVCVHVAVYLVGMCIILWTSMLSCDYHVTIMWLSCDAIMWCYHVTLSCDYHVTLSCDAIMWCYHVTLSCDYPVVLSCGYHVMLSCDAIMWLSCDCGQSKVCKSSHNMSTKLRRNTPSWPAAAKVMCVKFYLLCHILPPSFQTSTVLEGVVQAKTVFEQKYQSSVRGERLWAGG